MGSQQNNTAVQTETKMTEYNGTTARKISEIDKQGAQLLTQIQVFKIKGDGMEFESWIRHFENTLDIGDFEESRKIKYLVSKLMSPASDFVDQYRLDHPVEASCYKTLKRAFKDRFIGKNIEYKYQTSYDNCKREAGESVRAFACRVQKLPRKSCPGRR
jgi:truncated hemoglobin YjbI